MKKHVSIRVVGKVQGVFFRASTREKANYFGVNGFVRNDPDGSVYIEAEGDEIILEQFIEWCSTGPPRAVVDRVDVDGGDLRNFKEFEVLR